MKIIPGFLKSRYLLAVVSGLLLAAAFPNFEIAGLAWIAPGAMLLAAIGKPGRNAFRIGYIAGLAHYLASLYWLLLIPVPLAWKWAPGLGWLALSAFLSLFMGMWVWLTWKMLPVSLKKEGEGVGIQTWAGQILSVPWMQRMKWTLCGAALWVAIEMILARIFGGYPWNLLGDSQFRILPLIQIVSHTGVYGVSFLVVWSSLSVLGAAMVMLQRPAMRSACVREVIVPMAVVGALYGTGYRTLLAPEREGAAISLALIQPSIPQSLIWDGNADEMRFTELMRLSAQALTNKVDLLIWPEAAVPKMFRYDPPTRRAITGFARSNKVWMIIGADDAERRVDLVDTNQAEFFNSSFLVDPEGEIAASYKKRKLVMFGEYVPFTRWLPFLKHLTPITGGFTPGKQAVPFEMKDLNVKTRVLICFEDIFPHLAREYVDDETDFLVNLTNNGWFGEGAAQWQHGAAAIFRAIENGVPLVRCSNNGLTCWVDARGRIKQVFVNGDRGIYGQGYMMAQIPVLTPGEKRAPTFYRERGDLFGWGCVAFAGLAVVLAWAREY